MQVLLVLIGLFFLMATGVAHTQDQRAAAPAASDSKQNALIESLKTGWRAQDGEHVQEIIAQVAKVAHFIPRGWNVEKSNGDNSVVLSWAKDSTDKEGDEYTIIWTANRDGSFTIASPYAKVMELGWQAFALSLIQTEVDGGDENANERFLHDPSNLNFVELSQGKLGDLLKAGNCSLGDPIGIDYSDTWGRTGEAGDFWRLQLSVNCDISGPKYFVDDGVILFKKEAKAPWHPYSFFAHRISTYPPDRWFNQPDPKEQAFFAAGAQAAQEHDLSRSDAEALMKAMELRNDGSIIHWD